MNVFVESNFVLEVALVQEEAAACREILDLADARQITSSYLHSR